jgi:hypothetical protein
LLPLLANDCERTKRSRSGSIELPARSLFFSVSVSPRRSDDVDFARRLPAISSMSFLRVKQLRSRDSAPDPFRDFSESRRFFRDQLGRALKFSSESLSLRDKAAVLV